MMRSHALTRLILFVAYPFHPVGGLAVELLLNRYPGTDAEAGVLVIHPDGTTTFHNSVFDTVSVLGSPVGTFSGESKGKIFSDGTDEGSFTIGDGTGGLVGIHGVGSSTLQPSVRLLMFIPGRYTSRDPSESKNLEATFAGPWKFA